MRLRQIALVGSLLFFLAGCGNNGSSPTPSPAPVPSENILTGTWRGTTTSQLYGTEQTTFVLTQTGTQVSGTLAVATFQAPVSGTVSGSSATLSGSFLLRNGGTVEYTYAGTFSDTTFSGTAPLRIGASQEQGQFSVAEGTATNVPTQPPATSDIPFYGEWAWSFVPNDGCCNEEGRFSIVQIRSVDPQGSGFGVYQDCYQGTCFNDREGVVVYGPGEDNTLTITLFITNSANDLIPVYEATDDDGQLTEDEQGRSVFEGRSNYFDPNYADGNKTGVFSAVLTDLPTTFPPVNSSSLRIEKLFR